MLVYLVGETLDAAFAQEGDSDEEDAIVNQVLDEIGISINEKVSCEDERYLKISLFVFIRWASHHVFQQQHRVWCQIDGKQMIKMLKSSKC